VRKIAEDALDLIGNTPMVRINRLTGPGDATVLAKLERFNIGGSVKDRIAKYMIEHAEETGELTRDKIILEPTSGNTGIGLALVAALKGYRALFVMPESVSLERRRLLKAFGADFVLTPGERGMAGAIEFGYRMGRENPERYFMPDQFSNPYNVLAHYETTGKEIIEQTGGRLDMLIAAIGTGGTAMGVGKRLKEHDPEIEIVGVEPAPGESIQGMRNMEEDFRPSIFDERMLDERVYVSQKRAFEASRKLALKEGLLVGMSSGAVMHVALKKARELGRGKVVVAILPDGGERYLTTSLFRHEE